MSADKTIFGTHSCTGRDDCEVCHPENSSEALRERLEAAEKQKPCPFPESENKHISVALCGWRGSQLGLFSSRRNESDLAGVGEWFDVCPEEWREFASWLLRVAGVERVEEPDALRAKLATTEAQLREALDALQACRRVQIEVYGLQSCGCEQYGDGLCHVCLTKAAIWSLEQ